MVHGAAVAIGSSRGLAQTLWRPALEAVGSEGTEAQTGVAYLLEREFREVVALARMSFREREALEMARCGWSETEMGRALSLSRSQTTELLSKARRKLQAARERYPFAGLWEVYRDEVARL
ncbi:MAG: hypothetical protein IT209_07435 [Armatimonadetes bacterium]|nr:hypothetical protein [Armatimonadota bacterium]